MVKEHIIIKMVIFIGKFEGYSIKGQNTIAKSEVYFTTALVLFNERLAKIILNIVIIAVQFVVHTGMKYEE